MKWKEKNEMKWNKMKWNEKEGKECSFKENNKMFVAYEQNQSKVHTKVLDKKKKWNERSLEV
jgi:hypothetical protein